MNRALPILVVAKGLNGQRDQRRLLFGEHRRNLPFGGAVNAGVGPAFFPVIQIGLGLVESFETQSFQGRLLRMADTAFHFAFPVRMADAARQRRCAVMPEHIAVQRVERGIVNIGVEHALAQIVENNNACGSAQPAKGLLVQLGPDL
jgi:hypothetical protein